MHSQAIRHISMWHSSPHDLIILSEWLKWSRMDTRPLWLHELQSHPVSMATYGNEVFPWIFMSLFSGQCWHWFFHADHLHDRRSGSDFCAECYWSVWTMPNAERRRLLPLVSRPGSSDRCLCWHPVLLWTGMAIPQMLPVPLGGN